MKQPVLTGVATAQQACLETWINCESLLSELSIRPVGYAHTLEQTIDACAAISMETWQALKARPHETRALMILCIGICEECAALCDRYTDLYFQQCAATCRRCADSVGQATLKNAFLFR